jgi:hypothetical protein
MEIDLEVNANETKDTICVQKYPDWPPGARTANAPRCSRIAVLWVSLVILPP